MGALRQELRQERDALQELQRQHALKNVPPGFRCSYSAIAPRPGMIIPKKPSTPLVPRNANKRMSRLPSQICFPKGLELVKSMGGISVLDLKDVDYNEDPPDTVSNPVRNATDVLNGRKKAKKANSRCSSGELHSIRPPVRTLQSSFVRHRIEI
jgi:hypothetical protein